MRARLETAAKVAVAAGATFLVLVLAVYAIDYGQVQRIYRNWARNVLQVDCGVLVADARIYALKPGACRFANAEFATTVTVDADGYRATPQPAYRGPAEIAVTGDSHAQGWGVEDGETFAAGLARLTGRSVRNLAMSSYGTARELITLAKLAPEAHTIILQYCDNDYRENVAYLRNPATFADGEERRAVETLFRDRDRPGFHWSRVFKAAVLRGLGGIAWGWRLMRLPLRAPAQDVLEPQDLAREADAFGKVLGSFRSYLSGRQVVVIEADDWGRMRPELPAAFQMAAAANGVGDVRVLDMTKAVGRADFYHIDEHMTAAGHAKVAAFLAEALRLPAR